jgi:hypothetical protein
MLPVRSAIFKQDTGGLVVRWVTTGEYPLLYVFAFCLWLIVVVEPHVWSIATTPLFVFRMSFLASIARA